MAIPSRTLVAALIALTCGLSAPLAWAQPQTLFADDFETTNDNWEAMPGLWHVASAGECGAATGTAAFSDPATCTYESAATLTSKLTSKPFVMSGAPPYTMSFDHSLDFDAAESAPGDKATFIVYRIVPPSVLYLGDWDVSDDTSAPMTQLISFDAGWEDATVILQWVFHANGIQNAGQGWLIDNVLVTNSGGWTDLGLGLAGVAGVPLLSGSGTLEPGSDAAVHLGDAARSSQAMLVVGLERIDAAFKGGVLVPSPDVLIPLATDAAGTLALNTIWPSGVPAGTELFLQCWIQDATNPLGWSASNALKAQSP